MPDGPVFRLEDGLDVKRAVVDAQGCQQLVPDVFRERPAALFLQDPAGQVDAQVGVAVAVADRITEPRVGNAEDVLGEGVRAAVEVAADGRLVGEPRPMGEKMAGERPQKIAGPLTG